MLLLIRYPDLILQHSRIAVISQMLSVAFHRIMYQVGISFHSPLCSCLFPAVGSNLFYIWRQILFFAFSSQ